MSDNTQNQNVNTYKTHTDPQHGWLEVPFAMVYLLGIGDKLTRYSYMKRDCQTFYLEEDQDVDTFIRAYEAKFGARPNMVEGSYSNGQSFVRNLTRYDWATVLIKTAERMAKGA
tara:strand:+ start:975 stop:1316 length:342 start_codon:yes stop_codon:yes gene_type:complete